MQLIGTVQTLHTYSMVEPIKRNWANCLNLRQALIDGIAPWDDKVMDLHGVVVYRDRYPVTPGHLLFVPEYDTMDQVVMAFRCAELWAQALIRKGECDAYNIGINHGASAGQTVMYPHVHLIPRRSGDCDDPTGGIRAVIPGQANYRKPSYINPIKG